MDITDYLYEAAAISDLWPDFCTRLAESIGCYSAAIHNISPDFDVRWVSSPNIAPVYQELYASGLQKGNIRHIRHMEAMPFSFHRDIDWMSDHELEIDLIYNRFMRPRGLGWSMGDILQEPSGHFVVFDFVRDLQSGPFTEEALKKANGLRPDLIRASWLASRLRFEEARSMTSTLQRVGLPAAVITETGKVIAANTSFEKLSPRLSIEARNNLRIAEKEANRIFSDSLAKMRTSPSTSVQSLPVRKHDDKPAFILNIIPVRRQAKDIFGGSNYLLVANIIGEIGTPDTRVLLGLFDLTPGEAKIAREVAHGLTPEKISIKLGLSLETVRTYLKRIFQKTATTRQAELAALLAGISSRI